MKSPAWIGLIELLAGRSGILAYHGVGSEALWPVMHVSSATLRDQLSFVADHYSVVSLREYVARVRDHKSINRCVAITFDDAYSGVLTQGLEVLRDLAIPATIFVGVEAARGGLRYWWDGLYRLAANGDSGRWRRLVAELHLPQETEPALDNIEAIRGAIMHDHVGRFDVPLEDGPGEVWRSSTFQELRDAGRWDGLDFGVHTMTHPVLPLLELEEQRHEIGRAYDILREELDRVLPCLAYPYGLLNPGTMRAAAMSGMTAAVSMEGAPPKFRPDVYALPRIGVGEVHSIRSIRLRLARAMRTPLRIRKR